MNSVFHHIKQYLTLIIFSCWAKKGFEKQENYFFPSRKANSFLVLANSSSPEYKTSVGVSSCHPQAHSNFWSACTAVMCSVGVKGEAKAPHLGSLKSAINVGVGVVIPQTLTTPLGSSCSELMGSKQLWNPSSRLRKSQLPGLLFSCLQAVIVLSQQGAEWAKTAK